jgi:hypothetical protein
MGRDNREHWLVSLQVQEAQRSVRAGGGFSPRYGYSWGFSIFFFQFLNATPSKRLGR